MTVIPNFAEIHLEPQNQPAGGDGLNDWSARFKTETGKSPGDFLWETPELIKVKPLYSAADLEGIDHLDTMPGIPPYLRGPYSTMYVTRRTDAPSTAGSRTSSSMAHADKGECPAWCRDDQPPQDRRPNRAA